MQVNRSELNSSARLTALIRVLLLVVALTVLGVLRTLTSDGALAWAGVLDIIGVVFSSVAGYTALTAVFVKWVNARWQILLFLTIDIIWLVGITYLTGGVGSPVAPLLVAVMLTGSLIPIPAPPFLLSGVAALGLGSVALAYLLDFAPLGEGIQADPNLTYPPRVISTAAVLIGALFLVEFMGQSLARRLREQRLLTDELLDQLGEGVIAVDRDERILYGNDAAAQLLQVAAITANQPLAELLQAPHFSDLRNIRLTEELPFSILIDCPGDRVLLCRANRLVGRRGRMIGTTYLFADQTRLHELEEEANRHERLVGLGEMAAGIAHEVRNPLTSLRGCAQEMASMMRAGSQSDSAALVNIIMHESDRLAQLVEDFLGMARMRTPERVPLDLRQEFTELEELSRLRTDLPRDLRIAFSTPPTLPSIWADPGQCRQVLTNLINNAVEAVRRQEEPQVSLTARLEASTAEVAIEIRDNGIGIPAEQIEKIFTPFFSTSSQGTGLGMTMVSRILDEHQAHLRVSSAVGQGTTILVLWPLVPSEADSVATELA